ncbi:hypothetical protein LGQ02_11915 [Bacillus shivajii]|uniref:hypothetical protein n=1 Tax=Bacillus shivajii TaxID=1983719 RepID=UPI001CF9B750|nr:hypothetical protein [Bacillus shivajii]UCZ51576.1 hypothetical protein LGQ02_11915 [Bacillus shivajii]
MKENTVILTSFNNEQLGKFLPEPFHSLPVYRTGTTDGLPLTSSHLSTFFQEFKHVILIGSIYSTDERNITTPNHQIEFMLLLLYNFANQNNSKLSYLNHHLEVIKVTIENEESLTKIVNDMSHLDCGNDRLIINNKSVTSTQKIHVHNQQTANTISETYFEWLPKFAKIVSLNKRKNFYILQLKRTTIPLLQLQQVQNKSSKPSISEYVIHGGFLNKKSVQVNYGRFWFLLSPDKKYVYTSIVHFQPSLPWVIYTLTQSPIHELVMKHFAKTLKKSHHMSKH